MSYFYYILLRLYCHFKQQLLYQSKHNCQHEIWITWYHFLYTENLTPGAPKSVVKKQNINSIRNFKHWNRLQYPYKCILKPVNYSMTWCSTMNKRLKFVILKVYIALVLYHSSYFKKSLQIIHLSQCHGNQHQCFEEWP